MEQPKSSSVKILEVCKITPSLSPSPPAEFSLPLTFLDLPFFTVPPTEYILFYSLPPHASDSILHKLKHSLSLTLSHFFPLAGNVVWPDNSPEPFVLYKLGDSVSLTVAQTDAANFHRLSSDRIRKANESHVLVPQFQASDDSVAPIMCLQITLFPDVGFSIGVATNHFVVDGKTSSMFLKSWASICSLKSDLPTLDFDRTAVRDPAGLHKLFLKYFQMFISKQNNLNLGQRFRLAPKVAIPDDVAGGTFELTRADIDNLRRIAAASSPTHRRLSSFVLTYAHASTCMVKAQGLDPKSKVALSLLVDWRCRLGGSAAGENYFGNGAGGGCGLFLEAREFMGENGMSVISSKLNDVIVEMEERVKRNEGVELMDEYFLRWVREVPIDKNIVVAGSPKFGIYDIDFGWGRCRKVEMTSAAPGETFFIADSRNGNGGVELGIALPLPVMNLFSSLFLRGLKL